MRTKTQKESATILNIGCGYATVPLPGIREIRLDIDEAAKPDIVMDALKLETLPASRYDGVWCSHVLEHFYEHEVPVVLKGILHVLKRTGVLFIFVPDLGAMISYVVQNGRSLNDRVFLSHAGVLRPLDVLYGVHEYTEKNKFYAHKTGFDHKALMETVTAAGFSRVFYTQTNDFQINAMACKTTVPKWAAPYVNVK